MIGGFQSTKWYLPNNIDAAVDMVTRKKVAVTNEFVPMTSPKMARPFP